MFSIFFVRILMVNPLPASSLNCCRNDVTIFDLTVELCFWPRKSPKFSIHTSNKISVCSRLQTKGQQEAICRTKITVYINETKMNEMNNEEHSDYRNQLPIISRLIRIFKKHTNTRVVHNNGAKIKSPQNR